MNAGPINIAATTTRSVSTRSPDKSQLVPEHHALFPRHLPTYESVWTMPLFLKTECIVIASSSSGVCYECEETPENTHGGYEHFLSLSLEFIDQPTIHDVSSLRANPNTLSKTLNLSSDNDVMETRHSNANPAQGSTTDNTSTQSAARLEVPTVAPSYGFGTAQGQGQVVRHTDPVNGFGAEVEWIEVYEKKQKRNKKEKNKDPKVKNSKKAKRGCLTKKCSEGFVLNDGSKECLDIDECTEDPGVCQHNCTNTVGGYNCTCPPGYRISKDKRTCEVPVAGVGSRRLERLTPDFTLLCCVDHDFLGLPLPLVPGMAIFMIGLVQEVSRSTCPYHLRGLALSDAVTSGIPSFPYSVSVSTPSSGLTLQIQRAISLSFLRSR
ncbi:hypothetical protein DPMN_144882 [Dreissena polymorpha]|uniref:EGF-like domain-containing protein n=1 Tax=Dreissena polymorpha TaxID=45954 RepID=A0A9D4F416_DREPO|nr:hypothetical protein DPMN_144882 [Dreissena polymorpha]